MTSKYFSPMLNSVLNEKMKSKYNAALLTLEEAIEKKSIYNADYNHLKSDLNYCIYSGSFREVLKEEIKEVIKNKFHYEDSLESLYYKSTDSCHSLIAAKKLIDKVYAKHKGIPFVDKYKLLIEELKEMSDAMVEIKKYVIKSRKPSEKEVVINPNKIIKKCSCCFREIAIDKQGFIVHHGFQRTGEGYQTESCFGQGYKDWETSDEGTKAYIEELGNIIEENLESINNLPNIDRLYVNIRGKYVTITREDPNFNACLESNEREIQRNIRILRAQVEFLNKMLKERYSVEK